MKSKKETFSFTKQEIRKMFFALNEENIKLVHWLYQNHKDILREYEKSRGFKSRIEFLGKVKR